MKKIMICIPGRSVSTAFLMNWTRLLSGVAEGFVFGFRTAYDSNVYYVRQKCLGYDLAKGDNQAPFQSEEYDYMLWVDTDVLFPPEAVYRLVAAAEARRQIVAGIYGQGTISAETGKPMYSAVLKIDDEYITKYGDYERLDADKAAALTDNGKNPVIEVAYCGMGFMLVKRGVFEGLGCLPFEPVPMEVKIGDRAIRGFSAEDTAFCLKARAAGFRVFVDTGVVLGHEKLTTI